MPFGFNPDASCEGGRRIFLCPYLDVRLNEAQTTTQMGRYGDNLKKKKLRG